jgi:hypothetical protein
VEHLSPGQIRGQSGKCVAALESPLATTEYWYLRWWGTREESYLYLNRETNHQLYVLALRIAQGGGWLEGLREPEAAAAVFRSFPVASEKAELNKWLME